jgi:hypothetical protein
MAFIYGDDVKTRWVLMQIVSRCPGDKNLAQVHWLPAKYLWQGGPILRSGERDAFGKCNRPCMDNVIDAFLHRTARRQDLSFKVVRILLAKYRRRITEPWWKVTEVESAGSAHI